MRGLDTNVIVRYFTQDDPVQSRKANALIEEASAEGVKCFIDAIVLCELVWVLRAAYGYEKKKIVSVLEKLLSTVEFSIGRKDIAFRAFEEYRQGSGDFADYLIGSRNRNEGCETTFSFDQSLRDCELFRVL
jgi:predicted nucleic-acid-binding protein